MNKLIFCLWLLTASVAHATQSYVVLQVAGSALAYLQGVTNGTDNVLISATNGIATISVTGLSANESSNIYVGNPGVSGDNNVTRLGSSQTTTYISGLLNLTNGIGGYCTSNNYWGHGATGITNTAGYSQVIYVNLAGAGNWAIFNNAGTLVASNSNGYGTNFTMPLCLQPNGYCTNTSGLITTNAASAYAFP